MLFERSILTELLIKATFTSETDSILIGQRYISSVTLASVAELFKFKITTLCIFLNFIDYASHASGILADRF